MSRPACHAYTFDSSTKQCHMKGAFGLTAVEKTGSTSAWMIGGNPVVPAVTPPVVTPPIVTPPVSNPPPSVPSPLPPVPVPSPTPPTVPSPLPPVVPPPVPSPVPPTTPAVVPSTVQPPAVTPPTTPPTMPPSPTDVGSGGNAVQRGELTAFGEGDVRGSGDGKFACAYPKLSPWASKYYAAINVGAWEGGAQCGRCAVARCVDERCKVKDKTVKVYIVDQ